MATIGKLAVIISADAANFNRVLDGVEKRMASFGQDGGSGGGTSLAAAFAAGTGIGTVLVLAEQLGAAVGKAISTAVSAVKGAAEQVYSLGSAAVQTAADFERMEVAFGAMLGSAEAGKAMIADLAQLAAATPFQLTDLAKGTQRLMQFGLEAKDARMLIEQLGDLAAAAPQGMAEGVNRMTVAIGQMAARGKVSMQEMNQLSEAGVPALKALAASMGVSTAEAQKQIEAGAVSARKGILAIMDLAQSDKFAGMMQKQSQTLSGMWSTLKDNATLALRDLGNTLADALDLKGVMGKVSDFLAMLKDGVGSLTPGLEAVGTILQTGLDLALEVGGQVVQMFSDMALNVNNSEDGLETLKNATIDVFETMAKFGVTAIGVFEKLANAASYVAKFLLGSFAPLPGLGDALGGLFGMLPGGEEDAARMKAVEEFFNKFRQNESPWAKWYKDIQKSQDAWAAFEMELMGFSPDEIDLDFGKGVSAFANMADQLLGPFDQMQKKILDLRQMLFEDAKNGIDSLKEFGMAAYQQLQAMERSLGIGGAAKLPSLAEKGSKEAASNLIKAANLNQGGDIQERIRRVLDEALRVQKRTEEYAKQMAAALSKPLVEVADI
jgi:tape measure domain-containing protein